MERQGSHGGVGGPTGRRNDVPALQISDSTTPAVLEIGGVGTGTTLIRQLNPGSGLDDPILPCLSGTHVPFWCVLLPNPHRLMSLQDTNSACMGPTRRVTAG